ncbi:MAG: alpha/beta fold hydrolase, partial [Thermoanaerobaculia bacterium]
MAPASLALGLVVAGLAAPADKQPERVEPSLKAPQGPVLEWTSAEGRPYWYRLPRKIDRAAPPNLLLMLHGTGLPCGWAFWNYPIASGGFRGADIVVAPDGMTPAQGGTFNFIQGKQDRDQIAGLIGFFKQRFPIGKVYIYGHSQGAFFAYWFAGERPELIDGIVAHAGNVLEVKHPKLARERVAIGILHGKADTVVPVECAHRTEQIYRERGYRKLKLQVVEGLTLQSGHWPLPKQVGEMLAWLDSVSADSARGAIGAALHALAGEEPDLGVAVEAAANAQRLLKAYKGPDRDLLSARRAALGELSERAQRAHAEALSGGPQGARADSPFGAWAAHFRAAEAALGSLASWQASVRSLRQRAAKHDLAISQARAQVEKSGGRSFAESARVAEQAFLGALHEDLVARLQEIAGKPPAGVRVEEVKRFREGVEARRGLSEEGR